MCNACVVEMDHHCPYINNCVGRGNLRHFLLFLFWVTVAMLYALPVMGLCIYSHRGQIMSVCAPYTGPSAATILQLPCPHAAPAASPQAAMYQQPAHAGRCLHASSGVSPSLLC